MHSQAGPAIPNTAAKQDMPPKGGFPKIQIGRINPVRGPSGAMIFGAVIFMAATGFYGIGITNIRKQQNEKELYETKLSLLPYFSAEHDIDISRYYKLNGVKPQKGRWDSPLYFHDNV